MEWTKSISSRQRGVGVAGFVEGALGAQRDDGVEGGVHRVYAVKVRLYDFDGCYFALADGAGDGGGGTVE